MNRFFTAATAACMLASLFSQPAPADTRPKRGGHTLGQDFQTQETGRVKPPRGGHLLGPDTAAAARPIASREAMAGSAGAIPCPPAATPDDAADCTRASAHGR